MTRNIPIIPYIIVKNDNFSYDFGTTIKNKKLVMEILVDGVEKFYSMAHVGLEQLFLVPFGQ